MSTYLRGPATRPLSGTIRIPADKSISHRALIFNAFSNGTAQVEELLDSGDVASTKQCLQALGVEIEGNRIHGRNGTLQAPTHALNCGNSGTTIRILTGLLAGQPFSSALVGDESLQRRPMERITAPLEKLGATFSGPDSGKTAPMTVTGGRLHNRNIHSNIASAQVKTAVMLAGIQGEGTLLFSEPTCSRDHTERMFRAMGIEFNDWIDGGGIHFIEMNGPQKLSSVDVVVPGDFSSAAFFIVAATIVPDSDLMLLNIGLNPTRFGLLEALLSMGASIEISNERTVSGEPVGDIRVQYAPLIGTTIEGNLVTRMIDEIPVFSVAAAMATGVTTISDASELRVKESDRFEASLTLAKALGARVQSEGDGFTIEGSRPVVDGPFRIDASGDHRIAMAATIVGLVNPHGASISSVESIETSFPTFLETIGSLCD